MAAGVRVGGHDFGGAVSEYMSPEQLARRDIDEQLRDCGWVVQDYKAAAVAAAQGVAVREVPTAAGRADYVLFVDSQAVGVIEAKKTGSTLTGVEFQTRKYRRAFPEELEAFEVDGALPFGYESTGTETRFTSGLDPVPASRRVFTFHHPESLARWHDDYVEGRGAGLRAGIPLLPDLDADAGRLWPAQQEAVGNLEQSFKDNRPRALIQMATGSGKTFTAANVCYRLLRYADAQRILFLVDRANLGRQALREFQGFVTPDGGRKFTELYNVRHLTSSRLDMANEAATKVHICTVQRLYSILQGDDEPDDAFDETSGFETARSEPVEVSYNPAVPVESYDLIIIDECHRSIYGVWRQVLEYFDAFLVGLTATPSKQTFGFFDQNLVMEYGHAQAVADRVNVDFDVFRIRTEITEGGSAVPAGFVTEFRDRDTRERRWQRIDRDLPYAAAQLDRQVVAPDQIRTVVRTLRDSLPVMFPDRERHPDDSSLLRHIPKTLIFAKDDTHADDIVQMVRQEFNLGIDGAVKITYRSGDAGNKPEELLAQFRTGYEPRIAVTVDMIATGTDVKPIECVVFMRMVRSRNFFEQMKGRGVRVIDSDQLQSVTPDAAAKDRFVIVDAVGVTEADLHDTVPMERQPTVSLDKLLAQIGLGSVQPEVVSSAASRIARLDRRMTATDRAEVEKVAGVALADLVRGLVDALDVDLQHAAAAAEAGGDPTPDQVNAAGAAMIREAVKPLAANAALCEKLVDVRRSYEQAIDTASKDQVIANKFSKDATDRARVQVESWRQFIEDNKDEITALGVLYSQPYGGGLSHDDVKELANAIKRPPQNWTPDALWQAYETLDKSKVRGSGHRVRTDLVSLVRYALGEADMLVSYPELVDERFEAWLLQQSSAGRTFSQEQAAYLELIKRRIATNLGIAPGELMEPPFSSEGGLGKAKQLFGDQLDALLDELTAALAA
ncbi:DEAD/DEAH box helicase family protein [Candidatus Poriferisodalis multihospitum]|uniref:type I restriction endonuclease subunit R n=1 Tax=Candidatus Poriferisodalis multihospitum TaxID=2983191 RepID=UPI002B259BC3|nr:DEAD/DEAH box helicase family protein [Candidatus Poriferisodalis multihospitum]